MVEIIYIFEDLRVVGGTITLKFFFKDK